MIMRRTSPQFGKRISRIESRPRWREISPQDGFGNDPMYEEYVNKTYFLSGFKEENIRYFWNRLKTLAERDASPYEIEDYLTRELYQWSMNIPGTCLLEPFLFALKLVGNILEDEYYGLRLENIDAIAQVLLPYWHTDSEEEVDIVRHCLFYWSWLPSRAVLIRLYTLKVEFADEAIDKLIRKRLYFVDDSPLAFECLLAHPSDENEEALIKFLTRLVHRTSTGEEIHVAGNMQDAFFAYFRGLPDNRKEELEELYTYRYEQDTDNVGRRYFERLFSGEWKESPLKQHFLRYAGASPTIQKEIYDLLNERWTLRTWQEQELCRYIQHEDLLDLMKKIIGDRTGKMCSGSLFWLAQSDYQPARDFILQTQEALDPHDPQWMEFSLAKNFLTGKPDWDDLMQAYFLDGIGEECFKEIRYRARQRRAPRKGKITDGQFITDSVIHIATHLSIPPASEQESEELQNFFSAAQALYEQPFCLNYYPEELDPVLEKAFTYAMHSDLMLLESILSLIDHLITRSNRSQYYPLLQELFDDENIPYHYKQSANDIARKVF